MTKKKVTTAKKAPSSKKKTTVKQGVAAKKPASAKKAPPAKKNPSIPKPVLETKDTMPDKRAGVITFLRVLSKSDMKQLKTIFNAAKRSNTTKERVWKIVLKPIENSGSPIGLEFSGDIMLGSNPEGDDKLGVNLVDWQGVRLGVSKRHALLRGTSTKLFIMDMSSTNGTYVNGLNLLTSQARQLEDKDTISLGKLHFQITVM